MSRLLIVDDEPATVEMLTTFLQLKGFTCIGAHNGTDGLMMVNLDRPDLVILDLMMPDLEGFEVCQRIRADAAIAHTPVLILSARIDSDAKELAEDAGANLYMTKPPDFAKLVSEIHRLLAEA